MSCSTIYEVGLHLSTSLVNQAADVRDAFRDLPAEDIMRSINILKGYLRSLENLTILMEKAEEPLPKPPHPKPAHLAKKAK